MVQIAVWKELYELDKEIYLFLIEKNLWIFQNQ